ncbi:ATP-binding cassette domain-containing protein [Streptomyces sp. NBC_01481]|uniref:ATP-binding cassette domain-containing protein n=1 Tax=Streptomyces sp. NBC_01481 TaxID=2975869 RepID=UPI00225628FA|nr:ATP-binding cassette domain-containing protein [Streptomyces sp. NBC_01481]MCX4586070.1 ATP-binding cassette domain-containing protein [Streptomyces sp. NBC_01481]
MIEVRDLTKRFGDKVAVDRMGFTAQPGRVTGFLGANGSGKTTTMRMILGLDHPTCGQALVRGRPFPTLRSPLREVGAMLDARSVDPARTARNHLRWLAQSNAIPLRRVDEVLGTVGLTHAAAIRTGSFSLGMAQRLGIAGALLGDPEVLLLDEPVNGLDVEGILWLRTLLKGFATEGRTVFVSSHLMGEMEHIAQDLVIVGRGRLLAETSASHLLSSGTTRTVHVRSSDTGRLAELLTAAGAGLTREGESLLITGLTSERVADVAARAGVRLHQLSTRQATLEDMYLELTRDSTEYRSDSLPARA